MPTSFYDHIPAVCNVVGQLAPQSILDVGIGFGKWGHLFREQLDILPASDHPERYQRPNWKGRIDGIEGYQPYVTDLHRFLYNDIHVGDMVQVLPTLGKYDVIFIGDVIEHVPKDAGRAFLQLALGHANKAVIVSTPAWDIPQSNVCGNPLEDHRSYWRASDFKAISPNTATAVIGSTVLLAVIAKPGQPMPKIPRPAKTVVRDLLIGVIGMKFYRKLRGL
jgi:hypothetical protein